MNNDNKIIDLIDQAYCASDEAFDRGDTPDAWQKFGDICQRLIANLNDLQATNEAMEQRMAGAV